MTACEDRFQLIYGSSHDVAFLLDPRFLGDGMSKKNKTETEDFIINFPLDDKTPASDERKEKIYQQLINYQVDAGEEKLSKSFRFNMLATRKTKILNYWLTTGQRWPELQQLAIRVFQVAPSSTASERNFSTFGFVHSKGRNRLGPERVEKLVYIKSNDKTAVTNENDMD